MATRHPYQRCCGRMRYSDKCLTGAPEKLMNIYQVFSYEHVDPVLSQKVKLVNNICPCIGVFEAVIELAWQKD